MPTPTLQFAALTDVGCVRRNNEDVFGFDPALQLAVVCDGMGGMAAGEVASELASSTFMREFATHPAAKPLELRMALAIRAANTAVVEASTQAGHRSGMGTTLVAAAVEGSRLIVGNVGDSRAYLLRENSCTQITVDHSYLAEVLRSGRVREEDLNRIDRQRFEALVTRAVGATEDVEPDFFSVDLEPGDRILLTTDGLTRYFDCDGISPLATGSLEAACRRLIGEAKVAGGVDNITTLLIEYLPTGPAPDTGLS